jgi:hypothetical protein
MEHAAASDATDATQADVAAAGTMMTRRSAKCGSPHTFVCDGHPAVYLRALHIASSLARWN